MLTKETDDKRPWIVSHSSEGYGLSHIQL